MKAHPADIFKKIAELEGPGSAKAKQDVIKEYLDVPEFVKAVEYALNPFKNFFTQTVPGLSDIKTKGSRSDKDKKSGHGDMFDTSPKRLKWNEQFSSMFTLLDKMSTQALPPNSSQARDAICDWAKKCGPGTIDVFQKILRKDLRLGCGAKTFNKVKTGWVPSFEVQLAKPFDEKKLKFPCFVDPKFDGERCLAFIISDGDTIEVTYFSRNGLPFQNYGCFTQELVTIFKGEGSLVVDCEATNALGFQAGQKIPTLYDPSYDHTHSQLMVFDWVSLSDFHKLSCEIEQKDRYQQLSKWFKHHKSSKVFLVDTRIANSFQDAEQIFDHWIGKGLEGIILKQPDGEYEFRRTDAWMKLKGQESGDFKIVGMDLGDNNKQWAGKCGSLVIEKTDRSGKIITVGVSSGLTHYHHENISQVGDQILYTKPNGEIIDIKGKIVEVIFDKETDDGSLRFPRIKPTDDLVRTDK